MWSERPWIKMELFIGGKTLVHDLKTKVAPYACLYLSLQLSFLDIWRLLPFQGYSGVDVSNNLPARFTPRGRVHISVFKL